MAEITFYGAAQQVTGSCYLLQIPDAGKILIECGMQQGGDAIDRVGRKKFAFKPEELDAVILSHGHLDHSGMLPKLIQKGYRGPIYCTSATRALLRTLLEDAWGLYERDVEYENKRRQRSGRKAVKLEYSLEDVRQVIAQCSPADYGEKVQVAHDVELRLLDAGHILGSAIVELRFHELGKLKRLVFSGDLGNKDSALMNDLATPAEADLLMMESTYGDLNHRPLQETLQELEAVFQKAWESGGNVLIPAFAVGRSQEILFHLGRLYQQGKLHKWQVFLDSPMAIEVTRIYDNWLQIMDNKDIRCLTQSGRESLEQFLPTLQLCQTADQSIAINKIERGAIIIAGSGMCTGGRIRHHLKHRVWVEGNTIVFIGFQAQGTLGRLLVDGKKKIRMFGEEFAVRATIATLGGFSAHAGQDELVQWVAGFNPSPRVVLVHGESNAQQTLARRLKQEEAIDCEIPALGEKITF